MVNLLRLDEPTVLTDGFDWVGSDPPVTLGTLGGTRSSELFGFADGEGS